jgi:thiol-disulfide isomerase/thioredoxin
MIEQDVFSTRDEMMELLKTGNPGVIIIKYGAEWCGPCKKIEEFVKQNMAMMPENIRCITIDIDEAFDAYAFLKSKKLVSGIPAILAYYQDNVSYVPDQVVLGTDTNEIKTLFDTCSKKVLP